MSESGKDGGLGITGRETGPAQPQDGACQEVHHSQKVCVNTC